MIIALKLFEKDPIKRANQWCKSVGRAEPSSHDTTPDSLRFTMIYKKRWISRYFQECGIKVYADLNVSVKFKEYNKLSLPKGYNAFFILVAMLVAGISERRA